MELTITAREDDQESTTLVLVGSIDLVSRTGLTAAGGEVLADGRNLDLDMLGVDFIDSTGIGALVDLHNLAKSNGATFRIPERSARVERILQVTGLADAWAGA